MANVVFSLSTMIGKELYKINSKFKPLKEELELLLKEQGPIIKKLEESGNLDIDARKCLSDTESHMKDGFKLIDKCSKVAMVDFYHKRKFNTKLDKFITRLKTLFNAMDSHLLRDVHERVCGNTAASPSTGPTLCAALPARPQFTVGLDMPLEELKRKLLNDNENQEPIHLLTAPGGCGKTTLATMICHEQEITGKYGDNIFFIKVKKEPNLALILRQLYGHSSSRVPSFLNRDDEISHLTRYLRDRERLPFLLILDEVLPGKECLELLDKLNEFKRPSYNILVTTRSEFPRFTSTYFLKPLKAEDAMKLFIEFAGLTNRSEISEERRLQVLQRCKGLPLAIILVGTSLRGQPIPIWKQLQGKWSEVSSIFDSEKDLFDCLQSSLDVLDEQELIKECFTDLGSFPESQMIPAAALIDMWEHLHPNELIEQNTNRGNKCIVKLIELTAASLAELVFPVKEIGETDRYYGEHFVTQHALLRDLAIHQTMKDSLTQRPKLIMDIREDNPPKWCTKELYKQPIEARLVSISTDGVLSTKWDKMKLLNAEVLVLNLHADSKKDIETHGYAFPKFMKKMKKLNVLIVTYDGCLPAKLSNFELLGSLASLRRIRLERISVLSREKKTKTLKSLQKLSLFMCRIGDCSSFIQLLEAFPNLKEMNVDYCDGLEEFPAKLFDLVFLRKLSITNCHNLSEFPQGIEKLKDLEVLRLLACTKLRRLPNLISKLKKLRFLEISHSWSIQELPEDIGQLSNLKELNMRQCPELRSLPESIASLNQLDHVRCDEHTKMLWEPFPSFLSNRSIVTVNEDVNESPYLSEKLKVDFLFGAGCSRGFSL